MLMFREWAIIIDKGSVDKGGLAIVVMVQRVGYEITMGLKVKYCNSCCHIRLETHIHTYTHTHIHTNDAMAACRRDPKMSGLCKGNFLFYYGGGTTKNQIISTAPPFTNY